MSMHAASRRLTYAGPLSDIIDILRSVLPGCAFAIRFVRQCLRGGLEDILDDVPPSVGPIPLRQSLHVDDVSQAAIGRLEDIVSPATQAALSLVDMSERLRLSVSDKSVIVSSSPRLVKHIHKVLKLRGYSVKVSAGARDLSGPFPWQHPPPVGCHGRASSQGRCYSPENWWPCAHCSCCAPHDTWCGTSPGARGSGFCRFGSPSQFGVLRIRTAGARGIRLLPCRCLMIRRWILMPRIRIPRVTHSNIPLAQGFCGPSSLAGSFVS